MSDEEIVGIVDSLIGCPLCIGTGVKRLKRTNSAFQRPGSIVIAVLDCVIGKTHNIIVIEFRISEEYPIGIEILLGVRDAEPPVSIKFIQAAETEALISCIVDIVLRN